MLRYVINRLIVAVLVAICVSIISFGLLRLSGDLARDLAGEDATEAQISQIAELYGLDRPLVTQYFDWAGGVMRGDLGKSLFTDEPVVAMLLNTVGITALMSFVALAVALAIAIPMGVLAAVYANSWIDRLALLLVVFSKAMPNFWFALVLIYIFGVLLRWLPISGTGTWQHLILPVAVLALSVLPQLMRLTRGGMIEVLEADYVRTAWAKGMSPHKVFFKHALRNAVLPVVSMAAVSLGFMLGGSVIVESVFGINGIGALAYRSIQRIDFPVVQSILFFLSMAYVLLTLLADVINAQLDPRIRLK